MVDGVINGGRGPNNSTLKPKVHELKFTEDEIGMLIYRCVSAMSVEVSDYVWIMKRHNTPGQKRCKATAKIIFNNERTKL